MLRLGVRAEEDDTVVGAAVRKSHAQDVGVEVHHLRHIPYVDPEMSQSGYLCHLVSSSCRYFKARAPECPLLRALQYKSVGAKRTNLPWLVQGTSKLHTPGTDSVLRRR